MIGLERGMEMIREAVSELRSLRARADVSKTETATVVVGSGSWPAALACALQRSFDAFHCDAQVYWRDGRHTWMVKRGAQ